MELVVPNIKILLNSIDDEEYTKFSLQCNNDTIWDTHYSKIQKISNGHTEPYPEDIQIQIKDCEKVYFSLLDEMYAILENCYKSGNILIRVRPTDPTADDYTIAKMDFISLHKPIPTKNLFGIEGWDYYLKLYPPRITHNDFNNTVIKDAAREKLKNWLTDFAKHWSRHSALIEQLESERQEYGNISVRGNIWAECNNHGETKYDYETNRETFDDIHDCLNDKDDYDLDHEVMDEEGIVV